MSQGDRPVAGLRAEDFELRDDGVVQQVELAEADELPVQVLLVFDSSSSLTGEKRAALSSAGETLLAALRPVDEAGLLAFSAEIRWLARPTRDRDVVRRALLPLRPDGATSSFDALLAALAVADPRGRTLVVLFTDGRDNTSVLDRQHLRAVAERTSALVHLVTIGSRDPRTARPLGVAPEARPLAEIARTTGGRAWVADSVATLDEAFARIAATLATRCVLRYEPGLEAAPGWHRLEVRLRRGRGKVQSRRGYWVPSR